jgi:hypothetical protein
MPDDRLPKPPSPSAPSGSTTSSGKDARGRFAPGNAFGRGDPHRRKRAQLQAAIVKLVSADDIAEIMAALIEKAKAGDIAATKEVLDRVFGKPTVAIESDGEPLAVAGIQIVYADDWYGSRAARDLASEN